MSSNEHPPPHPPPNPPNNNPEATLSPHATVPPQPIPPPLPYLLEWTDYDPVTTIPQTLHRTFLPNLPTLLATLARPRSPIELLDPNTTGAEEDEDDEENEERNVEDPLFRRLLVFPHGLAHRAHSPLQRELFDAVLVGGRVVEVGVEPAFAACLVRRRPWRPAGQLEKRAWRRWSGRSSELWRGPFPVGGVVWEVPVVVELGGGHGGMGVGTGEGEGEGIGLPPPPVVRVLPGGGRDGKRIGVVFCRAGLWVGLTGSVLFLERAGWKRAARIGGDGEPTESLEDVVVEALREGWAPEDQLPGVIAEAVRHRWLELFDFLELQPQLMCDKMLACYLQMIRSLELNCEGEDELDWRALIARVQRRIDLASTLRDRRDVFRAPAWGKKQAKTPDDGRQTVISPGDIMQSSISKRGRSARKPIDENQRALDRLNYLAGILIPLPIISGILSMGDVYGPGGGKFFIFWAAAVPLAGLTVLLIYADTIRKGEVWVEVGADRVMPHPDGKNESSAEESIGPLDLPVNMHRANEHPSENENEESPPPRPWYNVPFATNHDVEERIIDMPAAAVAATVQPEDVEGLPRRARWSMGWGQVPTLILERPVDGGRPKAWRREQLGWAGAIQAILYKRFRDGCDVPEGVAACERPGRRTSDPY